MNGKSLVTMSAAAALAIAMISCGGNKEATPETPAAGTPAGKTVDTANAGSVKGTIKLDGTPAKMKVINMAAEPACAKAHSTPPMTEDVVVGDGGTLQNVIVYLKGDFAQYTFEVPKNAVEIDQKGCQYTPHVIAMMVNQPLEVVNSDQTTHNIHPVPKDNREWNESQPPGASPIMQTFAREEVAVPVKCNVHPWMKAYIAVLGHPYFQVTGKDGAFNLKNVPPGSYTLTAWHEAYGPTEQSVTVGPKEEKDITLTVKTAAAGN